MAENTTFKRHRTPSQKCFITPNKSTIRHICHCLFEFFHMVDNKDIYRSMNDMFRVITKINGLLQLQPMADILQD